MNDRRFTVGFPHPGGIIYLSDMDRAESREFCESVAGTLNRVYELIPADEAEALQVERDLLKTQLAALRSAALKYREAVRYGLRHGYDDRTPWLSEEGRALRIALGEEP